jgi:hypothetical protein
MTNNKSINIRNSFLNKNLIDDLFDGSFWFGKNHNKAEPVIIKKQSNISEKSFMNIIIESKKEDVAKMVSEKVIILKEEESKSEERVFNIPTGYIKLYFKDINPNEIFVNHNITMQYLTINGHKFIKELKLTNQGRELDCYSEDENESLTIEKISKTQLLLTLLEKNGNLEKFIIINGVII